MWTAIWMLGTGFAGLMWGILLTSISAEVKWSDAVSAIAATFAAIGTVGTLAFSVWQNYLNRRELLLQKLNLDAAELEAFRLLMVDVCSEAMRCAASLYFSPMLKTWCVQIDPARIAALAKRVDKARDGTLLPAVRGMCDGARACLDLLDGAQQLSPYLPRPDALKSIQEYLAEAKQRAGSELDRAIELHSALARQVNDLGNLSDRV